MIVPGPEAVTAALETWPPRDVPNLPGRDNDRQAAVLVPLIWRNNTLETCLTLRATTLRLHGGEVSFPGGKPDPEDPSLQATALREAKEELDLTGVQILGPLGSVPLYNSTYRLTPFLGHAPDAPLRPEPAEVAEVLRFDLLKALSRAHIHGLPWESKGSLQLSPMFEVGEHIVFGATAHVLHEVLDLLAKVLGRDPQALVATSFEWQMEDRRLKVGPVPEGRAPRPWRGLKDG